MSANEVTEIQTDNGCPCFAMERTGQEIHLPVVKVGSPDTCKTLTLRLLNHLITLLHYIIIIILCYVKLYYTILYHTILYYTILYYTILYYTILYYTILYYTILYYTILYYTILYYTILYYTIHVT